MHDPSSLDKWRREIIDRPFPSEYFTNISGEMHDLDPRKEFKKYTYLVGASYGLVWVALLSLWWKLRFIPVVARIVGSTIAIPVAFLSTTVSIVSRVEAVGGTYAAKALLSDPAQLQAKAKHQHQLARALVKSRDPFVLVLRPFRGETHVVRGDETYDIRMMGLSLRYRLDGLIREMAPHLKTMAVANPEDTSSRGSDLHSATLYLADSGWQPTVSSLIANATLIVVDRNGPSTPSLEWELEEIARLGRLDRTLVVAQEVGELQDEVMTYRPADLWRGVHEFVERVEAAERERGIG